MKQQTQQRWYPNPSSFPDHAQYEAHRVSLDQHYALLDRVNEMEKKQSSSTAQDTTPKGSATQINGMNVIGSPSADKSVLQWDAAKGELRWVAPDASSTDP